MKMYHLLVIQQTTNFKEHLCLYINGRDKNKEGARNQWLTLKILAIQKAEIRRIEVPSQPRQIVHKTLS
jgi:hypothetical protein